jgi:hypothetical protein
MLQQQRCFWKKINTVSFHSHPLLKKIGWQKAVANVWHKICREGRAK